MKREIHMTAMAGVVALSVLMSGLYGSVAAESQPIIVLGVLPVNQPETMVKRFSPLIDYLKKETGYNFRLQTYPTGSKSGGYTSAVKGLLSGDTPMAYLAPVTISQARHHSKSVQPIVCAVRGGSPTYVGEIVVRRDSDIQTVQDLVGRRVIGASPSSTSGNLLPSGMLIDKGIDKASFAAMDFAGGHDKAANAVLDGKYDAAWINDKNFQKFKNKGAGLRAIWVHDPVPEFPIAVNTKYLKPDVEKKILAALLTMHEKNLAALQAIDPKYERWVQVEWKDYQPVKATIDKVHGAKFYALKD